MQMSTNYGIRTKSLYSQLNHRTIEVLVDGAMTRWWDDDSEMVRRVFIKHTKANIKYEIVLLIKKRKLSLFIVVKFSKKFQMLS